MTIALNNLKARYPWPDVSGCTPWDYTLGGGGRFLIDQIIQEHKPTVMLEIGCFLCASSKRWLNQTTDMTLIGVDPWDDGLIEQCKRYVGRPKLNIAYPDPAVQQQFVQDIETQSPFRTALSNIADFQDRFIPVQGYSPDALGPIKDAGANPDLIYIDCNKKREDLDACKALWPNAIISGDDWHWGRTKDYPMRKIVFDFARDHGLNVIASHATWVLVPDQGFDMILTRAKYKDQDAFIEMAKAMPDLPARITKDPGLYFRNNQKWCMGVFDGETLIGAGVILGGKIDCLLTKQNAPKEKVRTVLTDALHEWLDHLNA